MRQDKRKHKPKKLRLERETLRPLTNEHLRVVNGGRRYSVRTNCDTDSAPYTALCGTNGGD